MKHLQPSYILMDFSFKVKRTEDISQTTIEWSVTQTNKQPVLQHPTYYLTRLTCEVVELSFKTQTWDLSLGLKPSKRCLGVSNKSAIEDKSDSTPSKPATPWIWIQPTWDHLNQIMQLEQSNLNPECHGHARIIPWQWRFKKTLCIRSFKIACIKKNLNQWNFFVE